MGWVVDVYRKWIGRRGGSLIVASQATTRRRTAYPPVESTTASNNKINIKSHRDYRNVHSEHPGHADIGKQQYKTIDVDV